MSKDVAHIVIGAADGQVIRDILGSTHGHVYVIDHRQLQPLTPEPRVVFLHTSHGLRELAAFIACDMAARKLNQLQIHEHGPSIKAFPQDYAEIQAGLFNKAQELFVTSAFTLISNGSHYVRNFWRNLPLIMRSPGIDIFRDLFAGKPAIVVGAGPSLDNNIDTLKLCQDKAVIIAAGSAAGALYEHGIVPHFVCATDPENGPDLAGRLFAESVLITPHEGPSQLIDLHPGRVAFCWTREGQSPQRLQSVMPPSSFLRQNISVATICVSLAHFMGCSTLIWVGQDLSFPDGKHHAKGVIADKRSVQTVTVPAYGGGEVESNIHWRDVLHYFVSLISVTPDIRYINATEGGARIEGAEQMTLAEVAASVLLEHIDSLSSIDNAHSGFIPPQASELHAILGGIRSDVGKLSKEVRRFTAGKSITINQYRRFTDGVRRHRGYDAIHPQFEPMFDWLRCKERDGEDIKRQYAGYADTYRQMNDALAEVVSRLDCLLKAAA